MSVRVESEILRHRQHKRAAWSVLAAIGVCSVGGLALAQQMDASGLRTALPAFAAAPIVERPAVQTPRNVAPATQEKREPPVAPARNVRIIAIAGVAPAPLVATR